MPGVLEALGEGEHLGDVLGRAREDVRRQDVDQRLVGVERGLVGVGDLGRRLVLEPGLDEHPVLAAVEPLVAQVPDVGDVLDVEDLEAVVQQDAPDEVGEQVGPQVADVGVAVDGRAAGVHPDPPWLERLDRSTDRVRVLRRRRVTGISARGGWLRSSFPCPVRRGSRAAEGSSSRSPVYSRRCAARSYPAVALGLIAAAVAGGRRRGRGRWRPCRDDRPGSSPAPPATLDPAAQGDAGSAAIIAQLFETLTAFDTTSQLQPALAESWRVDDGGPRVVFHLRPGPDVHRRHAAAGERRRPQLAPRSSTRRHRRRWLRSCSTSTAPPSTSPATSDASTRSACAPTTRPATVIVDLVRPRPTSRTSSPARRSRSCRRASTTPGAFTPGDDFVGSGGYSRPVEPTTSLTLRANARYWAGRRRSRPSSVVTDLGGAQPGRGLRGRRARLRADLLVRRGWIAYDPTLGPQLREVPSLSIEYYGFDTTPAAVRRRPRPPGVRRRPSTGGASPLGSPDEPSRRRDVDGPAGIPGRRERDVLPRYDPDAARALLAEAGYPGRRRLPGRHAADRRRRVRRGGRRRARARARRRRSHPRRWTSSLLRPARRDPPAIWSLSWVADYPGRNDFLGVLLGTGSTQQLRPLELAGVRRRDRRGRPPPTMPTGAAAAYDRAEDDRPARRAGRPDDLRHGLGAVARRAARRRPERPRHPAPRGAGVGRLMRARRVISIARRGGLLARRAVLGYGRAAAGRRGRSATPTRRPARSARPSSSRQPVTLDRAARRGSSCSSTYADALGPHGDRRCPDHRRRRHAICATRWPSRDDGHILPEHPAQRPAAGALDGRAAGSDLVDRARRRRLVYADDRFDWQTAAGDVVRVHWYEGGEAFGERALEIGEEAVARRPQPARRDRGRAGRLLHLRRPGRVLRRARAGHPRERRRPGERRDPDAVRAHRARPRSTTPWVEIVVPHELVHLVFDTAVENPYHFPPRWLNEGLGGVPERGLRRRAIADVVEDAAAAMALIPLAGLAGQFPTTGDASASPTPRASARSTTSSGPTARTRWSRSSRRTPTADRRRGVRGRDRHGRRRVRRGLAGRPRRRRADAHRSAAGTAVARCRPGWRRRSPVPRAAPTRPDRPRDRPA